jgi:hypothetical protein
LHYCVVVYDFNVFLHDVFYDDITCHLIFTYNAMREAVVVYQFFVYYSH